MSSFLNFQLRSEVGISSGFVTGDVKLYQRHPLSTSFKKKNMIAFIKYILEWIQEEHMIKTFFI